MFNLRLWRDFNANRNLCEDFVSWKKVGTQWFSLCAEIDMATDADVEAVKAEIFFQVQQYLAPPVINYTLAEMLARKKTDGGSYTVDEIFDGPPSTSVSSTMLSSREQS